MLPDRVSNPGPLTYESGALPIALHGPAHRIIPYVINLSMTCKVIIPYDISVIKWLGYVIELALPLHLLIGASTS